MATRTKQQPMGMVTIGYQRLVLPQAQAIKLYELASQAMQADYDFTDEVKHRYQLKPLEEVKLTTIRADEVILPEAEVVTVKRGRNKPLLLN